MLRVSLAGDNYQNWTRYRLNTVEIDHEDSNVCMLNILHHVSGDCYANAFQKT